MGSGSSKAAAAASSPGGDRRERSRGARVFNSFCCRPPSTLSDDQNEEEIGRSKGKNCTDEEEIITNVGGHEACRTLKTPQPGEQPSLTSSKPEPSQKEQDGISQADSGSSSSSMATTAICRSSNPSGRLHYRFGVNPDGIGFRLSRAVSLGSSGRRAQLSASFSVPDDDQGDHVGISLGNSSGNRSVAQENSTAEILTSLNAVSSDASIEPNVSGHSHRNHVGSGSSAMRHTSRRLASQETLEGSIRFSRTCSVGRHRDRVLHGTSLTEGLFGPALLEERSEGYIRQSSGRRVLGGIRRAPSFSERNNEMLPDSSHNRTYHRSSSMDSSRGQASETPQLREASNYDLLEHRSVFLERRRRIRSQVRALQRLGRRFENLSGHDRSCILSGQHRTGRCTCRTSNHSANPDMSPRASISRIVMLAEALFEVLDEINQQSVALSSRPSFSCIRSAPSPEEVVESLPMKAYMKPQKCQNEEDEQCYICLVEYEEGDYMRILPCNHEFHQLCIDKWLKEIHRVCPLCRGDVCRTNVSRMEQLC